MKKEIAKLLPAAIAGCLLCAGCGRAETKFGAAAPERKAEFVGEIAAALKGYPGVIGDEKYTNAFIEVKSVAGAAAPAVFVKPVNERRAGAVEHELAVALTDIAVKYPGLGFQKIDGGWVVLTPDDMTIPLKGGGK